MEKYGFVYIWRDRKHNRYYIGCHWGLENDSYVCSSSWMKRAYKLRPNDFKRKVIAKIYSNKHDLFIEEHKWLSMIKSEELGKKYYNLTQHLNGHWSSNDEKRKTISEKLSEATKKTMTNPEIRKKISESLKGRKIPLEVREKITKAQTGLKRNLETRKKMSEMKRGKPNGRLGKFLSEETKRKISEMKRGKLQGPRSPETKRKISETLKARNKKDNADIQFL